MGLVLILLIDQCGFQFQLDGHFQCKQFPEADSVKVVFHELLCSLSELFRVQCQRLRARLRRFRMCFQPVVMDRVLADFR